MKITTAITCELSKHGEIEMHMVERDSVPTVSINQNGDVIWIPRADIAEFCRILSEWEAGQ